MVITAWQMLAPASRMRNSTALYRTHRPHSGRTSLEIVWDRNQIGGPSLSWTPHRKLSTGDQAGEQYAVGVVEDLELPRRQGAVRDPPRARGTAAPRTARSDRLVLEQQAVGFASPGRVVVESGQHALAAQQIVAVGRGGATGRAATTTTTAAPNRPTGVFTVRRAAFAAVRPHYCMGVLDRSRFADDHRDGPLIDVPDQRVVKAAEERRTALLVDHPSAVLDPGVGVRIGALVVAGDRPFPPVEHRPRRRRAGRFRERRRRRVFPGRRSRHLGRPTSTAARHRRATDRHGGGARARGRVRLAARRLRGQSPRVLPGCLRFHPDGGRADRPDLSRTHHAGAASADRRPPRPPRLHSRSVSRRPAGTRADRPVPPGYRPRPGPRAPCRRPPATVRPGTRPAGRWPPSPAPGPRESAHPG